MKHPNIRKNPRLMALIASAALVFAAFGRADEPTKTKKIDAGGLAFNVPETWKTETPKSAMRKAQLKIDPVKGDDEGAEFLVFAFPGGAGTVEANVERWEKFFVDDKDANPKAKVKKVKGKNVEVTRVEISGRYVAPIAFMSTEKFNKPNFRLLGAIVETPDAAYFIRMIGPEKTMTESKADFDAVLESIEKK